MKWSADTLSAATKNPLHLGIGSVKTHEKMIRTIMGSAINQNIEPIIKSKEKFYIEDDNMSAIIQYKRYEMDPSFIIEGNKLPLKKIPFFKVTYIKK